MTTTHSINNRILHLRSVDRDSGNSSDFTITFKQTIQSGRNDIIAISVLNAQIPISFYNISHLYNHLDIAENETHFSITIEPGNYNVLQLINVLKTQIELASPNNITYTFVYDSIKNKVQVKNSNENIITQFLFYSGENAAFDLQSIIGGLFEDFSFSNEFKYLPNVVNMQPVKSIYIRSNIMGNNTIASRTKTYTNILSKIPISAPSGSILYYQNVINTPLDTGLNDMSFINISLTDADNDQISLNGLDWEVTLLCHFIPKSAIDYNPNETIEVPISLLQSLQQDKEISQNIPSNSLLQD